MNSELLPVGVFTNLLNTATHAKFVWVFLPVVENTDKGQWCILLFLQNQKKHLLLKQQSMQP
jgi:hypothetical protein